MSTTSRGSYYKKKSQKWFEDRGYTVQLTEFTTARPSINGRVIYIKKDVFGSDGIAMNGKEIIFWNSKHFTGTNTLAQESRMGTKEYKKYPFPTTVKRWLLIWEPRVKEPHIVDVI